jgi:AhpD family alkylhydroperoxidase
VRDNVPGSGHTEENIMKQRFTQPKVADGGRQAMLGLERYLAETSLDVKLRDLLKLRVSQINGCAYCIDMHWKDLRKLGENEQRLYGLDAWRESPYYTDRERAALAWAEAVTNITDGHVPDEVHAEVRQQFSEAELVELTMTVVTVNAWNRLAISFRYTAGSYQPMQH